TVSLVSRRLRAATVLVRAVGHDAVRVRDPAVPPRLADERKQGDEDDDARDCRDSTDECLRHRRHARTSGRLGSAVACPPMADLRVAIVGSGPAAFYAAGAL